MFRLKTEGYIEKSEILCLTVTSTTFHDVRRNWNCCTPYLRSQPKHLFLWKPSCRPIHQEDYFISQLKCPKLCVIPHA